MLLLFFVVFLPSALYFGSLLDKIAEILPMKVNILEAPLIWDYLGYAGNWIVFFFLGALVIYTVTIDANNKTLRQNIITGLSRKEFYLSKILIVIVLATLATVYYSLLATVIGWFCSDDASISSLLDNDKSPLRFWLMSFGYMNIALMIAFLIRKAGLAVFAYFTYGLLGELILRNWLKKHLTNSEVVHFFPINTTSDLMPSPLLKMAEDLTSKFDEYLMSYTQATIGTIIYSFIFILITFTVFKNMDI